MANYKAAVLLVVSLLVVVALAEARFTVAHQKFFGVEVVKGGVKAMQAASVTCDKVHAVDVGETCFSVANNFKLSEAQFLGLNPNINCAAVFVGQWICIDGTIS